MTYINSSIYQNTYIIKDNSQQHLLNLGFHKYYDSEECFVYNFPVLKYENMIALRCRIIVYVDTKKIKIDVTDNNYALYKPFYNIECGNYEPIMDKINKNILEEFKKLGVVEKEKKE